MLAAAATAALLALPAAAVWLIATRRAGDWRVGLGVAGLVWALWAVATSELLSLGAPNHVGSEQGQLTRGWLLVVWGVPALAGAAVLIRTRRIVVEQLRQRAHAVRAWSRGEQLLLAGTAVCLALTLLTALAAAPNNWDSQVYHLARVAMWERLGGIAHYPTHVDPQLYQPPGAELLVLQGYVLAGSDRLAALPQWFAYAGSIALGAAAAAALGGSRLTQLTGALLVATTPLAILQASSTQNDLLLAFWLLLATTLAARVWTRPATPRLERAALLGAAAAIGMAVLTKGTGLLLGLPVGLFVAAAALRRLGLLRALPVALAGLALASQLNLGHWMRNHETYGTPVATQHAGQENPYRVDDPDLRTLAANLVRNATNHLDLPLPGWNDAVEQGTRDLLATFGADADDPRTTFFGQPFRVGPFGPHEDHAGSILLLVLALWAAASTVRARWRGAPRSGVQLAWLGVIAAQVLLFSWLLTWQNWHVRLHLPMTLLAAALVAARLTFVRRGMVLGICALALLAAPLYLLFNVTRPLVGEHSVLATSRTAEYFRPRPQLRAPYEELVRRLDDADVREVGVVSGVDDWHYPLVVLGERATPDIRFREVLVGGPSAKYERREQLPEAVVCLSCSGAHHEALQAAGLQQAELEHGGARRHEDDTVVVELWLR